MTINRNNYEEFFLLYVDNELSAQDKIAVDVFLKENPDLQEEMLMLQQSILLPDTFVFADKENLLKPEAVNEDMQEQLLLMLDNELDKKSKQKLLKVIEKDAAVKKEWEILQQTKLTAEEKIIFKDKAILYKEEGGRVIAVKWWRIAAAALLIGFGVWGALNYPGKTGLIEPKETVKNAPEKSSPAPVVPGNKTEKPSTTDKSSSIDAATAVNETKQDKEIKTPVTVTIKNKAANKNQQQEALQSQDVADQKPTKQAPSNNLPKPLENINNNDRNNNDVAIVPHSNNENDILQPAETTPEKTFAVNTNYQEDGNKNEGMDEDENKSRKSKIGGFFKKLKRVVERKTNMKSEDNSFKIANVSFAMQ